MNKMKTEIHDTSVLCRICGEEFSASLCLSIFSESGMQQNLQHKINSVLRLEISKLDSMPTQVCHMCLNKLDAAFELLELCNKAQDSIRRKLHFKRSEYFLQERQWSMIEEKCKLLTEHSPIIIGGSIFKLKPVQAVQHTMTPTPQNNWIPTQQQQPAVGQVSLNYTNNVVPTTSQTNQVLQPQYNQGAVNNSIQNQLNNYSQPAATVSTLARTPKQQVSPNKSPARVSKPTRRPVENKKYPRPIPCPPEASLTRKSMTSETVDLCGPSTKKVMKECHYCNNQFSENDIVHHISLHLRQAFFSCVDCNKNFKTEKALETHRCVKNVGD